MSKKEKEGVAPSTKLRAMPAWYDKFCIPPELIEEAGVRRVTDREARTTFGLQAQPSRKLDGLLFPYLDPNTEQMVYCRVRLDSPQEGEGKYHAPSRKQRQRILYYPPCAADRLKSKKTTLILVEAEKSALALEAWARRTGHNNVLPVAMGGCQGWQQKDDKGHSSVLPDLDTCNGRTVVVMVDANYITNADVREARDKLVAELSGRRCTVSVADIPQLENVNGPDDLLALKNGDDLMAQALAKASAATVAPYSEQALAIRFAKECKDTAMYAASVSWYGWEEPRRWKLDDRGFVDVLAHNLCKTAAAECGKLAKAERIRSRKTREAILREAQPYLAIGTEELDKNPMLLGTPSGVVDLCDGKMRPARREDYITMLTAAAPNWELKPVQWLAFLRQIMCGDEALVQYLQRVFGYCLTGQSSEHAVFYFDGTGRNGKGTLVETLLSVLGDYGTTVPMSMFVAKTYEEHPTSTAALFGKRMVAASETREGQFWDEAKLKLYSGGDTLKTRFMRKDEFSFRPQFKLALYGNHRPRLRNLDAGIRDRFHIIPFNVHYAREDDRDALKRGDPVRDTKLSTKLRAEWGGILAWAIDGCLAWQRSGLRPPKAVLDATRAYMDTQDSVMQWAGENLVREKGGKATASVMHQDYARWAVTHHEYTIPMKEFVPRLEALGYHNTKPKGISTFPGVRLKGWRACGE